MPAPFFLCKKSCLAVPNNGCLWNSGFIGGIPRPRGQCKTRIAGVLLRGFDGKTTQQNAWFSLNLKPPQLMSQHFAPIILNNTFWNILAVPLWNLPTPQTIAAWKLEYYIQSNSISLIPFILKFLDQPWEKIDQSVTKGSGSWLKKNKTKGATANLSSICSVNHDLQLLGSSICSSTAKIKHDLFLFISASANRKSRKTLLYTVWLA